MMRFLRIAFAVGLPAALTLLDCVGDSPVPNNTPDASSDGPAPTDGGGGDAPIDAAPACPALVDGGATLEDAIDVSVGDDFACAIRRDGSTYCWGSNKPFQQLARPISFDSSPSPIPINGLTTLAKRIYVGQGHAKIVDDKKHIWAWGSNIWGEAGTGDPFGTFLNAPHRVVGPSGTGTLDDVVDMSSGADHACAVTAAGKVLCWGRDTEGQLGSTTLDDAGQARSNYPIEVPSPGGPGIAVAAGQDHTCAIFRDGSNNQNVWCFGGNGGSQLGTPSGTLPKSTTPVKVANISVANTAVSVSSFGAFSCAKGTNYDLTCWGLNADGVLGPAAPPLAPQTIPGYGKDIRAMSARFLNVCAITAAGNVECTGTNKNGELGQGTNDANPHPTPSAAVGENGSGKLDQVFALSVGGYTVCAVRGSRPECGGSVLCWGKNSRGQAGIGSASAIVNRPTRVVAPQ